MKKIKNVMIYCISMVAFMTVCFLLSEINDDVSKPNNHYNVSFYGFKNIIPEDHQSDIEQESNQNAKFWGVPVL